RRGPHLDPGIFHNEQRPPNRDPEPALRVSRTFARLRPPRREERVSELIDIRSDTVTRPTPAMRRAMAEAEVGDDVFGDDPTLRRLEERIAALTGKEAALYVVSGTMGNQLAIRSQTRHGDEVLLDKRCHIYD